MSARRAQTRSEKQREFLWATMGLLGSFTGGDSRMQIDVTEDAQALLRKKGGTMTVDYIRPTG